MQQSVDIARLGPCGRAGVALVAIGLAQGIWLASAVGGTDQPPRPADDLLRLVPPDVAVVVTVEGLRDQARAFGASRLAGELRQLAPVKAWLDSERFQQFERSRAQIEAFLGSSITEIRDELLGDAVVLALRLPADVPPDPSKASGLLLVRARNQVLLKRVMRIINTAQEESGELARIGDIDRNGTTYHVREFPAGANRLPEWYVTYADGTFALSNSESLIQAVVDRKLQATAAADRTLAGNAERGDNVRGPTIEPGLASLAKLQAVERRLPERALARLFVDPRPIARLIAASARPRNSAEGKMLAMLERYLAAVDYAGAAMAWTERSLTLHTVESLDPSKLDPWVVRWAGDVRPSGPVLELLPPTALAKVAMHVDGAALFDAIRAIIPDQAQARLMNFETILNGLLLGQHLKARILPACAGDRLLRRAGRGRGSRHKPSAETARSVPPAACAGYRHSGQGRRAPLSQRAPSNLERVGSSAGDCRRRPRQCAAHPAGSPRSRPGPRARPGENHDPHGRRRVHSHSRRSDCFCLCDRWHLVTRDREHFRRRNRPLSRGMQQTHSPAPGFVNTRPPASPAHEHSAASIWRRSIV